MERNTVNTNNVYDIIIPIYNGFDYLHPLFNSLFKGTTILHRLIIIDDCNTDPKVLDFIMKIGLYKNLFCQEIIIIRNQQNQGFIYSVNCAVKQTKYHFVILNSDTELPVGWLERLMEPIETDEKIASVTPLTNSGTICSFPNWLTDNSLAFDLSLEEIDITFKEMDDQKLTCAPTGVGFCMAINCFVVEQIAFFNEIFGQGYGEENDWCMRAKALGYRNVILHNLYVYHKHGGSFEEENKRKLMQKNQGILMKLHPSYEREVHEFIHKRPLNNLFAKVSFNLFLKYQPAIIFSHAWGGGSDFFIKEHLYQDIDEEHIIIIRGSGKNVESNIELIYKKNCIYKTQIPSLSEILHYLSLSQSKTYYLNHVVQLDDLPQHLEMLIQFLRTKNIKPIFYLHDYFSICPTINLIDKEGKYCGMPRDLKHCNNCLSQNSNFIYITLPVDITIQKWRNQFSLLLMECEKIFVFSKSSSQLFKECYPYLEKKIALYKLHLKPLPKVIHQINYSQNKKLKIGILGAIGYPKGIDVINKLSIIIRQLSLPLDIIIIGTTSMRGYFKKTGVYLKKDLPQLVISKEIDLFIIPSIWPETYCYTVDEIINMGFPLICFDIGAPPERVAGYEHGFLVKEISIILLLQTIFKVAQKFKFTNVDERIIKKIKSMKEENLNEIYRLRYGKKIKIRIKKFIFNLFKNKIPRKKA